MITGVWSTAGWSVGGWACRVNHERMAYRECRELVEEPELYSEENGRMPLRCRVYLLNRESWSMEELLCCWWQLRG